MSKEKNCSCVGFYSFKAIIVEFIPGDATGQNVREVWFVISPTRRSRRRCVESAARTSIPGTTSVDSGAPGEHAAS